MDGPASAPAAAKDIYVPGKHIDPVPHELMTQPYRVVDDLEEITSRINNLYRKPFRKLFDASGVRSRCRYQFHLVLVLLRTGATYRHASAAAGTTRAIFQRKSRMPPFPFPTLPKKQNVPILCSFHISPGGGGQYTI